MKYIYIYMPSALAVKLKQSNAMPPTLQANKKHQWSKFSTFFTNRVVADLGGVLLGAEASPSNFNTGLLLYVISWQMPWVDTK